MNLQDSAIEERRSKVVAPSEPSLSYPTSIGQQHLWFLEQLDRAASTAYHMAARYHLQGSLDLQALRAALDAIVARHAVLRTRFALLDGEPVHRVVAADAGFDLAEHDLSGLPEHLRERRVEELSRDEARARFELAGGLLIRGALLRLGAEEHVLLITQHHIISDGWSSGVLLQELAELYGAFTEGRPNPLPALPLQYADYVLWQRQRLQQQGLQEQLRFWKSYLAGAPALLNLPSDRPHPPAQSYAGDRFELTLSPQLTQRLRALGHRHGVTLFMTLLAGWSALLSRISGQTDLVIGTPVANRPLREFEPLMGYFANMLALRIGLEADPSVAELLRRVRARTLEAFAHQEMPFTRVVEALQPTRSLSYNPIFQVALAFDNAPGERGLRLPGLKLRAHETPQTGAKFDLTWVLRDDGQRLEGSLDYATDLFERSSIERLGGHLIRLLEAMVADDSQRVSALPLLSAAQRQQLLVHFNDSRRPYPLERCVHELIEAQVERTPHAIAVEFEGCTLSYGQLDAHANRLAQQLIGLGVRPDVRVAICMERSLEMVVALLGVLKAGGAYVPLDPTYPCERLAQMLEDSAPLALLRQRGSRGQLPPVALPEIVLDLAEGAAGVAPRPGVSAADLAYVIYTSGSTGTPKGAMNIHRGIVNRLQWMQERFPLGAADRVLQKTPFTFDVSVWEFFWPLSAGAQLVLARPEAHRDNRYLMNAVETHGITVIDFVPPMLQAFLQELDTHKVRSLRHVFCGGQELPASLAQRFLERLPAVQLHNMYGPTETSIGVVAYSCFRGDPSPLIPIGRPIANTQIYILDAHGEPVPIGVAGEIHIGGAGVGRGYLNRPELTAERFVPDPFSAVAGSRLYRTGDLGRWRADGNIEFLGRNDGQVKVRGFRIELGEIEAQLLKCAGVKEAVAVAREDEPGEKRLVAYVTAQGGAELSVAALRSELARVLPDYMIPSAIVRLESLPLTPNGKLDRRGLPLPDASAYAARGYEAPEGDTEQRLARLWAELLQLERVGREDNFFELGGHSLTAVRLMARIGTVFGVQLGVATLFAAPTLRQFARRLSGAQPTREPSTEKTPIAAPGQDELLPVSFAQQRLWFLAQMEGVSAAYHIPFGLHIRGELDEDALRRALDRIVARHEALRTRFRSIDGEPFQVIAAEHCGFSLQRHDLHGHPEAQGELQRLMTEEVGTAFDLQTGPLLRGRLVQLATREHVLLITLHHIVADGWSMPILARELDALYGACRRGEPDPLPPLPTQYAAYARWQRRALRAEVLRKHSDYWRRSLLDAPALLELPADRPRPEQQDYAGGRVAVSLDAALTAALKALSRRHGTTLFMTLLAGWAALLARLSGQQDLVIGVPAANRGRTEIEPLIGFFVNSLALRLDLSGSPSVGDLLRRVRTCVLEALQHQAMPFEQVVETVRPRRTLAYSPVFQVVFAWQNDTLEPSLPGLTVERLSLPSATAKFDLTLSLGDSDAGVVGTLEYATALRDHATVERYVESLQRLLAAMVANETQAIDRLPLLSEAERQQLVVAWNDTARSFPGERGLHQLFDAQAAQTPDALAIVHPDARLTYAALLSKANQLAQQLRSLGVEPGDRVAIGLERSIELVIAELAILKCGAAYVPLDQNAPPERQRHILDDCCPRIVLSRRGRALPEFPGVTRIDLDALHLNDEMRAEAPVTVDGEAAAYVMYTSGSTGHPKGVVIPHRGVARLVLNNGYAEFRAGDRIAFASNPAFDASTLEVWAPLLNGGCIVVIDQAVLLNPESFARQLQHDAVDVLWLTAGLFQRYADTLGPSFSRLRYLIVGGDVVDPAAIARVLQHSPPQHLLNGYGPTETTTFATTFEIRSAAQPQRAIPIGRPIANTQIYILDAHGEPVPIGVAGEIHIGGAGVGRGYLNRPELTAERFVPDPFSAVAGSRLYRTGDLGRWRADGNIEFLGRNDGQVKVRGFRIELGEIEAQLLKCAGVKEAVAVAREDEPGEKRLVAYVTAQGGAELSVAALRSELARVLPDYMIPSAIVRLESLPLTPNGKLDRRGLPLPDASAYAARGYEAPEGDTEQRLARLWAELLQLERVGREDNFFELGGHSLTAVRLMARIGTVFGVQLGVATLFAAPTLRQFARRLSGSQPTREPWKLMELQPAGEKTPIIAINNSMMYYKLSQKIGSDRKFFALQLLDPLNPTPLPSRSLEQLAAEYVQLIRAAQPHGPYILMGLCVAGLIAYEAARQLRQAGEQVPLVVMADTWSPGVGMRAPFLPALLYRLRFRLKLRWHTMDRIRTLRFEEFIATSKLAKSSRFIRLATALGIIRDRAEFNALTHLDRWFLPALERARHDYRPPVSAGDVLLLESDMLPLSRWSDPTMGWGDRVEGQLLHHRLPGWHNDIFREEGAVTEVAEILRPLLDQVDAASGPAR